MTQKLTALALLAALAFPTWGQQQTSSVETVRQDVQSDLHWLANSADWLLGGTRADDIRNESTLRVHADAEAREYAKPTHGFHVQLVTKIATLERWQKELTAWAKKKEAKLEHEIKEEFHHEREPKTGPQATEPTSASPSQKLEGRLQELKEKEAHSPWQFSLDKRFRYRHRDSIDAEATARVRRDFIKDPWMLTMATSVGWSLKDLWQADASADIYRHLSKTWLVTFSNSIHHEFHTKSTSTSHGPSLNKLISSRQAISFGFFAGTNTSPEQPRWDITNYSIPVNYRIEFIQRGFFAAISPSLDFPKSSDFRGEAAIHVALQQVF